MLSKIDNGHSGNVEIELGEASLSFKASLSSLSTKSLSDAGSLAPSTEEAAINSCTLILFEGDQVSSIMKGLFVNDDNYIVKTENGTKDDWAKMIVKVKKPSPYSVMVIANNTASLDGCVTKDDIKTKAIQKDKDALVKFGELSIDFPSAFTGYPTIAEAKENPLVVSPVSLYQLSARIELAEFNVVGFQGASKPEGVVVTGVDVFNLNPESYTTDQQTHRVATYGPESKNYTESVYNGTQELPASYSFVDNGNPFSFYSFRNLAENEDDQVKIQVRFKVGNSQERKTSQFVINKAGGVSFGVQSGYVYRLILNMTIIGDKVETELLCYTNDWLNNPTSIPMEEVN